MKDSKSRPPLRKDAPRAKLATPAGERPKIYVRLEPSTYQRIVDAAEANHISVTAEAERRLEKSLEPNFASQSLEAFDAHVMAAFRMGGQLAAPDRPFEEWKDNPAAIRRAVALGVEAMMSWFQQHFRDAAGNPIKVRGISTTVNFDPAEAGQLAFITTETKRED